MKAAVYYHPGGSEVFRYEDVPDPAVPADGVLVRVQAISIEGGDTLHRARRHRPCRRRPGQQVPRRRPGDYLSNGRQSGPLVSTG